MSLKRAAISIITSFRGNEITYLVGKRIPSGRYGTPGGKIELNEKSEDAMVRELKEETSLDAEEYHMIMNVITEDDWNIDIYVVKKYKGDITNVEPSKCEGWEFKTKDELLTSKIVYALKHFLTNDYSRYLTLLSDDNTSSS